MYERVTDKQEEKVSKILSGSVDKFSVESEPVVPPVYAVPPTLPSTVNHPPSVAQPMAGSHYYNCTVNMYEMPKQSAPLLSYFPSWNFFSPPPYPPPPGPTPLQLEMQANYMPPTLNYESRTPLDPTGSSKLDSI